MRELFSFSISAAVHALLFALLAAASWMVPRPREVQPSGFLVELHAATPTATRAGLPGEAELAADMAIEFAARADQQGRAMGQITRASASIDLAGLAALPAMPDGQLVSLELPRNVLRGLPGIGDAEPGIRESTAPSRALHTAEYTVVVELFEKGGGDGGLGGVGGTSTGGDVEQMPRPLASNLTPPYPPTALAAKQEGRVVLAVFVSSDGSVVNASISTSSGHSELDNSALTTVYQWRFAPARRNGKNIAFDVLVPIRFEILANRPNGRSGLDKS